MLCMPGGGGGGGGYARTIHTDMYGFGTRLSRVRLLFGYSYVTIILIIT